MECANYLNIGNKIYYGVGQTPKDSHCKNLNVNGTAHRWDRTTHCCFIPMDYNNSLDINPKKLNLSVEDFSLFFAVLGILSSYLIIRAFK